MNRKSLPPEKRIMVTLTELYTMTGMSRTTLLKMIEEGSIKGTLDGKRMKYHRASVEQALERLSA